MLNLAANQLSPAETRHDKLRGIIAEKCVISGRQIQLASGRTSDIYFNMKHAIMDPEGANLMAEEIIDLLSADEVDCVGGLEMGAVPVVQAVTMKSYPGRPIPGFFVRKQPKTHGTRELIDGNFSPESRVVVLDDVTTTGGSVIKAIKAIREAQGTVNKVITVVDRLEGAHEALRSEGVELVALFTRNDFRA